jgi:2-dehydro-3-deoxygalactonokinase
MHSTDRIVVDWGTSSFRAYRFGGDGAMRDTHRADAGILVVTDGGFEPLLDRQIGGWITPRSEILLSGMITSRNGWVETPYVTCPATLASIAEGARTRRHSSGALMRFLPGVSTLAPTPDVMRGEEIQVFGSIAPGQAGMVVLPGTHSKWVVVDNGAITGLRTFLTGEMFALLRKHSIVGRLIPEGPATFNAGAFLQGVEQAGAQTSISLLNDVFTARSGALLDAFPNTEIADRLSGILVGHELKAGLGLAEEAGYNGPILLVGEAELTQRYALALAHLGWPSAVGPAHAAVEGFRRLTML